MFKIKNKKEYMKIRILSW